MKKLLFFLFLITSSPVFSLEKSSFLTSLRDEIEDNYAVIKKSPENPYQVSVSIYLKNKDVTIHKGNLSVRILTPDSNLLTNKTFPAILTSKNTKIFTLEVTFPKYGLYRILYNYTDEEDKSLEGSFTWLTEAVNFFYAFTTPHRLTTGLPDSSGKTLLDFSEGLFSMGWTYDNLVYFPFDAFRSIKQNFRVDIRPEVNGVPFKKSSWTRLDGWLPMAENIYETDDVKIKLIAGGVEEATIVKISIANKSNHPQHVRIPCLYPGNWKGYNPGWVDKTLPTDHLLAGWGAPANKVVVLGIGADTFPPDSMMSSQLNMDWKIPPGETRQGFLIRPYDYFAKDLDKLRAVNWEARLDEARERWKELVSKAARIIVPDDRLQNAYFAGIADFFIMREPIGKGYMGIIPGTDVYRSAPNATEATHETIALSQLGMFKEAKQGYQVNWDLQEPNGDWTEPGGWTHLMWCTSGYKSWAALEYFLHSHDTGFLQKIYPKMLASSRWQQQMRKRTKILNNSGEKPLTYGLMPKGMGDGGLRDGESNYGIFYMHNIFSVFADSLNYKAATILGNTKDAKELYNIYQEARTDLIQSMNRGAITDSTGKRWLSAVPGKITGSSFGLLGSIYPTKISSPFNELMTNTIARIEAKMSPGGLPVHTGFMADGMWVAMTLNDFAPAHLLRDEPDIATALLYAAVNHATPLYSWCEERGQFPGAKHISGDLQHLWTPIALVRFMRDMLVMEDDQILHLARGVTGRWIESNKPIGISKASTYFGEISYEMQFDYKQKKNQRVHCLSG